MKMHPEPGWPFWFWSSSDLAVRQLTDTWTHNVPLSVDLTSLYIPPPSPWEMENCSTGQH